MATIKQKALCRKIIENNGNVSKSMREVGYSKETAKNPKNVTNSIGFQELIQSIDGLKDDQVLQTLSKSIHKGKKITVYGKDGTKTKEIDEVGNAQTRGMDMFFKLRGHYAPEKKEISGALSLSELFGEE
jgi:hypothetical protein